MKIAYLLKGQSRDSAAGARLFKQFVLDRFPQHDIRVFIHSWTSVSNSSAGDVTSAECLSFADGATLNLELKRTWNPVSVVVTPDEYAYTRLYLPLAQYEPSKAIQLWWRTGQILSSLLVQSQLNDYINSNQWTPDVVVSTKQDIVHYPEGHHFSAFENLKDILKTNHNALIHTSNTRLLDGSIPDDVVAFHPHSISKIDPYTLYRDRMKDIDIRSHNSHSLFPLVDYVDMKLTQGLEDYQYARTYRTDFNFEPPISYYTIINQIVQPQTHHKEFNTLELHNSLYRAELS
jgi:hypothetical protein